MVNHFYILPLAYTCRESLPWGGGDVANHFIYSHCLARVGSRCHRGEGAPLLTNFYILPLACTCRESLLWVGAPWLTILYTLTGLLI